MNTAFGTREPLHATANLLLDRRKHVYEQFILVLVVSVEGKVNQM